MGHGARCSSEIPPQSLPLPATNIVLAFLKPTLVGTLPSNILKDKFKYVRRERLCNVVGMVPDKLFHD